MEWDDQRELVLNVAEQVKVLVVGPEENRGHDRRHFT